MNKILFINHPQVGHLNPLLSIALQMREDGFAPAFLIPGMENNKSNLEIIKMAALVPKMIRAENIPVALLTPTIWGALFASILPFASGYREWMLAMKTSSIGIKSYTKSIINYLKDQKPRLIVFDYSFYAANIAADHLGIPAVALYHTGLPFKGKDIPPFGSGLPIRENAAQLNPYLNRLERVLLNYLDKKINRARRSVGLENNAPEIFRRPCSQWLNLIASHEAIEAPRENLTNNTFFIGPCISKRKEIASQFPFALLLKDRVKIYVSLGTVFNNRPTIFRKIMHALDNKNYQVIVSAGGAYEKLKRETIPPNIMLFPSVPQIELLPHIDIVIGHGGNNSTNETLAAGKPLLVMPIGGEQGDNASRIEYLGAGLRVDIDHFTAEELQSKIKQLSENEKFRQRTQQLKQALDRTDGARTASVLIQRLLDTGKPLTHSDFPAPMMKSEKIPHSLYLL